MRRVPYFPHDLSTSSTKFVVLLCDVFHHLCHTRHSLTYHVINSIMVIILFSPMLDSHDQHAFIIKTYIITGFYSQKTLNPYFSSHQRIYVQLWILLPSHRFLNYRQSIIQHIVIFSFENTQFQTSSVTEVTAIKQICSLNWKGLHTFKDFMVFLQTIYNQLKSN